MIGWIVISNVHQKRFLSEHFLLISNDHCHFDDTSIDSDPQMRREIQRAHHWMLNLQSNSSYFAKTLFSHTIQDGKANTSNANTLIHYGNDLRVKNCGSRFQFQNHEANSRKRCYGKSYDPLKSKITHKMRISYILLPKIANVLL